MKRIAAAAMIAALMLLAACGEIGSGGVPVPGNSDASAWTGGESSTVEVQITDSQANDVYKELSAVLLNMADGVYPSDMAYLRRVSEYLGQFKIIESDTAVYMESVRVLCTALSSLYARNITAEEATAVVSAYESGYEAMSSEFKATTAPIDKILLGIVVRRVDALAVSMTQSQLASAVSSEAPQAE